MQDMNYRINNLTVEDGKVLHLDYQTGVCNQNDECCVRLRNLPGNISSDDVNESCFDSVCSQHFNDLLKFMFDKQISLEDWKKMDLVEVIFALIGCYPQYKILKLLIRYACGAIHDQPFSDKKVRFEGEIASIEPFVESVWQVKK